MRFLILSFLFIFTLLAQEINSIEKPKVYTSLGDEIYANIFAIEKLKQIDKYKVFTEKIDIYVTKVKETKVFGYEVASGNRSNVKLDYLKRLREHKKENDYFIRSAHDALKSAMDTKDNILFVNILNNGLIDTRANKQEIMSYYKAHSSEINPKGIIQTFLDEEDALKNAKLYKAKTKAELQKEKVARLRKNDKLGEEDLEQRLSKELKLKKEKIIQEQERELFN